MNRQRHGDGPDGEQSGEHGAIETFEEPHGLAGGHRGLFGRFAT